MSMIDRTAEVLARAEARAAAAVRKAAGVVLEEVEQRTPVNTGAGERSYHVADGDNPHTVYVTNTDATSYLKYVEQGTSKMAARPHLVPGAEAARARATEELAQSLREAL
jgi:HK97 gp10 family phage protein